MKKCIKGLFLILVIAGCESAYTKMVKKELSTGIREDSLIFNIEFGDTKKEFYDKCWQLNKKELVTNGPKNQMVEYTVNDSLFHDDPTKIKFLFYGTFDDSDKLNGMDCEFAYPSWSPWNQKFSSDSLEVKVRLLIKNWYSGNDFIEVPLEDEPNLWVKVDGNRRIVLKKLDQQSVSMKIHDLLHDEHRHNM
ncbi:MAG: hypothetical protein AAGA02_02135 [Bacteroidota bacterium]